MGLFSFAKKASKALLKRSKPLIVPTVTAFGGAAAGEIAGELLGPKGRMPLAPTRLPPLPIGQGTGRAVITRSIPPALRPTGPPFALGGIGCPAGFHPAKDGSGRCVRNRRMNVLNPRAANRAIRRIKGAMKMLRKIERQMPKQRTRRAPSGHRARLTHD